MTNQTYFSVNPGFVYSTRAKDRGATLLLLRGDPLVGEYFDLG